MKIGVLGTICFDEILLLDGSRRESFGGITYNAAALSSVVGDGDAVRPLSNVGEDRYDAVLAAFSGMPHVDVSGLTKTPGHLMHVALTWLTEAKRDEKALYRMPPYDLPTLAKAGDCDGVHVNFIHGTELDIKTLAAFRAQFSGLLSLDVHNAISEWHEDGTRSCVGFQEWPDWVAHFDTVQCNEFEVDAMFERSVTTRQDYIAAAKEICAAGPRAVSVTLGPEGAVMVHRKDEDFFLIDIDVLPPKKAVDTTGCGDSFSAGFLIGMLTHDDPATALACASVVAGVNSRYSGIGQLKEARDYLAAPRSHFAVFQDKPADWPGEPI